MAEITEKKAIDKKEAAPKLADPIAATIDVASQQMIRDRKSVV